MNDTPLAQSTNTPVRPCGKCTLCCTTMGVDEFEKKMWQRCNQLSATRGCGCYTTRPESCRIFECLWRTGFGTAKARPDKSGVIFVTSQDRYALVALVDSKRPNAWKKGEAKNIIDAQLENGVPVFIACRDARKALLPTHSGLSPAKLAEMKETFMKQALE